MTRSNRIATARLMVTPRWVGTKHATRREVVVPEIGAHLSKDIGLTTTQPTPGADNRYRLLLG